VSRDATPAPRDFTYIQPSKRRVSEYEAVSLYVQVDPDVPYNQLYMRTEEGRKAWRPESTRLRHPHWFDFRDPGRFWQRPYVRMQAEQERAIERLVEDAKAAGAFDAMDRSWLDAVLRDHYRVWSFFEYGLFRAFGVAQREALSDPIGNALTFQGFDHMRHAQAVVLYLLDLEGAIEGFRDEGAKARWLEEPVYQPLRRIAEELISFDDWAELCIVTNFVVLPLVAQVGVSALLRQHAPLYGDLATPVIVLTTERDRRRNIDVAGALAAMALDAANPDADANRAVMADWFAKWQPRALAAAEALAPVWRALPKSVTTFDEAIAEAMRLQRGLLDTHALSEFVA
jgi:methane monooxygenase component A beta chain/propane monooxygenase small subunit